MTCTNASAANAAYIALLAGEDFNLAPVDLEASEFILPSSNNQVVVRVNSDDVTTKAVGGTGTFDVFSAGIAAHLQGEYEANRITGADFTKAYISLMESALVQSVQFSLNKEQMYWQSQLIQAQAITARVALMTAKVQLAQAEMDAKTSAANFALTKAKIRESELASCAAQYNLETTLPKETALLHSQIGKTNAEIGIALEQRLQVIEQTALTASQREEVESQTAINVEQRLNVIEQTAVTHAQIAKTESDTAVNTAQRLQILAQTTLTEKQSLKTESETAINVVQRLQVMKETDLLTAQIAKTESDTAINTAQLLQMAKQLLLMDSQIEKTDAEILHTEAQTSFVAKQAAKIDSDILTAIKERLHLDSQIELSEAQVVKLGEDILLTREQKETVRANTIGTRSDGTPIEGLVGNQIAKTSKEIMMIHEQMEAARASTSSTRLDGSPVAGSIGKQMALHQAQIESFERDAETKIAKLMVDMWVTQKTIDEGLLPPSGFDNTAMNAVIGALRTNTGI